MPGPIQSGISSILTTATGLAGGSKLLKGQKEQAAEAAKTAAATEANTAELARQAANAEAKAELEYKAGIKQGLDEGVQRIYDEETKAAFDKVKGAVNATRERTGKEPTWEEAKQGAVYLEYEARKAGERAMSRVEWLEDDPFRKLQRRYVNGEIGNREDYKKAYNELMLREPTGEQRVVRSLKQMFSDKGGNE